MAWGAGDASPGPLDCRRCGVGTAGLVGERLWAPLPPSPTLPLPLRLRLLPPPPPRAVVAATAARHGRCRRRDPTEGQIAHATARPGGGVAAPSSPSSVTPQLPLTTLAPMAVAVCLHFVPPPPGSPHAATARPGRTGGVKGWGAYESARRAFPTMPSQLRCPRLGGDDPSPPVPTRSWGGGVSPTGNGLTGESWWLYSEPTFYLGSWRGAVTERMSGREWLGGAGCRVGLGGAANNGSRHAAVAAAPSKLE